MWKNSNELMCHAFNKLKTAILSGSETVEIVLEDSFAGDLKKVEKYCNQVHIKTITEILREEFNNYEIKSKVGPKGALKLAICYSNGPCDLFYPLVWELTLKEKAT